MGHGGDREDRHHAGSFLTLFLVPQSVCSLGWIRRDPAWSQASLLGFLPMQVGSQWAGDNFPCLVSTQVPSACRFSLVSCALDAACFCSWHHLPILPLLGSETS